MSKAIDALLETYEQGERAGDVSNILGCYDDQAIVFSPWRGPQSGIPAIRDWIESFVAEQSDVKLRFNRNYKESQRRDYRIASGNYTLSCGLKGKRNGAQRQSGVFTLVLKKAGTQWKICRHSWCPLP